MDKYYIWNHNIEKFLAQDGRNWTRDLDTAAGFLSRKAAQDIANIFSMTKAIVLTEEQARVYLRL